MADFVAVLATHGPDVLLASSGRWVQDIKPAPVADIYTHQRYPAGADTPLDRSAALLHFASYAAMHNFHVGEVTWKPADKNGVARYSTKYIFASLPHNPPGFVKGTVSPRSADPVFLRRKAIAEFQEEIGIRLADADLTATAMPNVFVVDMTKKGARDVAINAWRALGPVTEVVHLEWVPISSLPTHGLNPQSEKVRHLLPGSPGPVPRAPVVGPAAAGSGGPMPGVVPGGRRIRASTLRRQRSRR